MLLQSLNFGCGRQFLNLPNPNKIPIYSASASSIRCVSELAGNDFPVHGVAGLLHNKVIVSAVVAGAIGQLTNPFSSTILYGKKFDLKTCLGSGGFPSTHSSSVVATATCLAIERGFSDSLFGLAAVYASLVMYDAQGVRREVGTHARVLNKVKPYSQSSTNELLNSYSKESSSSDLENTPEERSSFQKTSMNSLLVKPEKRIQIRSAGDSGPVLKESIEHTEVEVTAGALLGLVVSLVICSQL